MDTNNHPASDTAQKNENQASSQNNAEPVLATEPDEEALNVSTLVKPKKSKKGKKNTNTKQDKAASGKNTDKQEETPENAPEPPKEEPKKADPTPQLAPSAPVDTAAQAEDYFAVRKPASLNNASILLGRMSCNIGSSKNRGCVAVMDTELYETYADVPGIPLSHVWRIVNSEDARTLQVQRANYTPKELKKLKGLNHPDHSLLHGYTEETWKKDMNSLINYMRKAHLLPKGDRPILLSDVWSMSEFDFQTAFLDRAHNAIPLLQFAIMAESRQCARLAAGWKHIKKYIYRVQLEKDKGGVFSEADATKLRLHGIRYLNDIRKHTIYELKNLFLDHDFVDIIREINAAFKEDLALRRDVRFKVRPYVAGFAALAATAVIALAYRYTLIKNDTMTYVILGLLAVCVLTLPFIFYGAARAKRRRQTKRPGYYYFTQKVRKTCRIYATVAAMILLTLSLFYLRYDGYNGTYYYRNLDDGGIAIAGTVGKRSGPIEIPEKIDGKKVTEIDLCAFYGEKITSVTIPQTVKSIDRAAFINCKKLKTVQLPEGLTEIRRNAFRDCEALNSLTLPSSLTTLERGVFEDTAISSISFVGTNIKKIPEGAFLNCERLASVDGLNLILEIEAKAFKGCIKLAELPFSQALSYIGDSAFEDCTAVKTLVVPASVDYIGEKAFKNCTSLVDVTLPYLGTSKEAAVKGSLKDIMPCNDKKTLINLWVTDSSVIGSKAFDDYHWVNYVNLNESVKEIRRDAFKDLEGLKTVEMTNNLTIVGISAFEGCTGLKSITGTEGVTEMGAKAFKNCTALPAVTFTNLKKIPTCAFQNCKALKEYQGLEAVTSIGDQAFMSCSILPDVIFGASLKTIGSQAFDGCKAFKTVTLPNSVESIGSDAFANMTLSDVSVPFVGRSREKSAKDALNTVFSCNDARKPMNLTVTNAESFNKKNLKDCESVKNLVLTAPLNQVEEGAFRGLKLISVTLPDTLKALPNSAFEDCTALVEVKGSEYLQMIGDNAFKGCKALPTLALDSLRAIGQSAFEDCTIFNLSEPLNAVETIGEFAFKNAKALTSLTINSQMQTLDEYAFSESRLTSVILPESLREICVGAFENSVIEQVTILGNLEVIGDYAFHSCKKLTNLELPASLKKIGTEAFSMSGITALELSHTALNSVGIRAFAGCDYLSTVTLPATLKVIPEEMMADCKRASVENLSELTVTDIEKGAFSNTSFLDYTLVLPGSVKNIGEKAFYNTSIAALVLPNSVETVEKEAFAKSYKLTQVTAPFMGKTRKSQKNGAKHMFGNITTLKNVEITDMTKVETTAFDGLSSSLRTLVLNNGVTEIKKNAFEGFKMLEAVVIPDSVTKLGSGVFQRCTSLATVRIPSKLETIPASAFANCTSLSHVDFSDASSLHTIKKSAFASCTALSTIEFPKELVSVEKNAFQNCNRLNVVVFSDNMTRVNKDAFGGRIPVDLQIPEHLIPLYAEMFGLVTEAPSTAEDIPSAPNGEMDPATNPAA